MEQSQETYTKIPKVNLELHAREEKIASRVMGGKALYNDSESRFTFVENPKRGRRSKLISATSHATLRLRENGAFSMSFVFEPDEKYLTDLLISETRELAKKAVEHTEKTAKAIKEEKDESAK